MTNDSNLDMASIAASSGRSQHDRRDLGGGSFGADALVVLRVVAVGVGAGFLWGAVIGGLGGRMAMFLLRLTSDPQVRFRATDDGFGIGSFTFDTIFLVVFLAVFGVVGGVAYLGIRRWLPAKGRNLITGVVAALVGGALFIEPGGVDFTLLSPLWLAVALFIVLPGLYGFALSWSVERLLAKASVLHRHRGWRAAPAALLVLAGPLAGVLVVIGAGLWAVRRYPRLTPWWQSAPVTWAGRVALATVTVFTAVQLVDDAIQILG